MVMFAVAAVVFLCFSGCKKSSDTSPTPDSGQGAAKTAADYEASAEKEITEQNMDQELEKLEKEVDADARSVP
jgi:outer membrane protein assembly factor BamE (lipoprotein component of BamABCDE complex)